MQPKTKQQLWGIVLAAGENLCPYDSLPYLCRGDGSEQFWTGVGCRSMLEHTLARVERLIPRERVLVVVSAQHREQAVPHLARWPPTNVIVQPHDYGTGPEILLSLAHLSHRQPFATAAIFPANQFVWEEEQFMAAVSQAVTETQRFPRKLTYLGVTPSLAPDGDNWIEPVGKEVGYETRAIHGFWEHPSPAQAPALLRRGAVKNTFVCVGEGATLWEMARQAAPDLYWDFMAIRRTLGNPRAKELTENIYQTLRSVNFFAEVCQPLVSRLRVLPVPNVGWREWGSQEHLRTVLQQIGQLEAHLIRLRNRGEEALLALSHGALQQTCRTVPVAEEEWNRQTSSNERNLA